MLFAKSKFSNMSMQDAKNELVSDPAIHLIDVRSREEYRSGHIPGSVNIPLDQAQNITQSVPEKSERIFVYCLSGGRSRAAAEVFAKLGYTDVTNIGGITSWPGDIERG